MHKALGSKAEKLDRTLIVVDAFKKNDDGSWECIQNTDIKTPDGIHRLCAGMVFQANKVQWGVNITELLEQEAANA